MVPRTRRATGTPMAMAILSLMVREVSALTGASKELVGVASMMLTVVVGTVFSAALAGLDVGFVVGDEDVLGAGFELVEDAVVEEADAAERDFWMVIGRL